MSGYSVEEAALICPYCGEQISVLVDTSAHDDGSARYIEDCQVCCRPIALQVNVAADGTVSAQGFHENDT